VTIWLLTNRNQWLAKEFYGNIMESEDTINLCPDLSNENEDTETAKFGGRTTCYKSQNCSTEFVVCYLHGIKKDARTCTGCFSSFIYKFSINEVLSGTEI
jgi:hypothetical protein